MLHPNKKYPGFTLIELLVVIAIIGLLSTLAVVSLNSARAKARDAKRLSDLRQIERALQLYWDDNEQFPSEAVANSGSTGKICETCTGGINTIIKNYISTVPTDPTNDSTHYYYYDGYHSCYPPSGGIVAVLFATQMENSDNAKPPSEVCPNGWGGEGSATGDAYVMVLGAGVN